MKELYKKYKREIWVGVVVSLITSAIIKFGDWLLDVVPTVGTTIFETVSNILYSLAATYTDSLLLRLMFLGGISVIVGSSLKNIIDSLKVYRTAIWIEKECAKYTDDEKKKIFEYKLHKNNIGDYEDSIKRVERNISESKRIGKSAISVIIILIFSYLYVLFCVITPMNLSNNFSQDIVKIAPYIEEYDVKKLQSDWVCMRSKADYDKIYEVINDVKKEHNLPK